jgi:hypothetical protein
LSLVLSEPVTDGGILKRGRIARNGFSSLINSVVNTLKQA